ncbi:hypothetical protein Gohar_018701 [Gossypium harknessii]|uniref:RNase H type-1 domain-containing protein n=1 Tax=Gossypium harknessii TaxID=34285 RepID=A0A7J9G9V7_9ROSI|nr:hypothetical protein [Gossypium harknessii]
MKRNIRERIDKGVATDTWLQLFPTYSLRYLPHSFLDHYHLLIETEAEEMGKRPGRFHFEAWWVLKESCEEEKRKLWEESSGSFQNRILALTIDLIDANTRKWKFDLIRNTFMEKDAERILCIPLSMNLHKDRIIWRAEGMACLQVINLGLNLRLKAIKIEGDSRSVIRKLQAKEEDRYEIEVYIKDSKQLNLGFGYCVFRFTHKESNKEAVDAGRRWTRSMKEIRGKSVQRETEYGPEWTDG